MTFNEFVTKLHHIENEYGATPEEAKTALVIWDLYNKVMDAKVKA